jgi:5-methylcytosine-specific restriction enzyme subunit McrC
LAKVGAQEKFELKPDLALRQDGAFRLLLDTKYKTLDADDRELKVSQEDFYQMHAYLHRYECPRVVLVYPRTAGMPESRRSVFDLLDAQGIVEASAINLCRDLSSLDERELLIEELGRVLSGVENG